MNLFPYQQKDIAFFRQWGRCANWSQPGTGKTAVALNWLPKLPALVVAPSVVLTHWVEEVHLWRPELRPAVYVGPKRKKMLEGHHDYDVLITSYDIFRRDAHALQQERFATIIFDEAHRLKNPKAQVVRAAAEFTKDPYTFVMLMTGTPVVGSYMDIYSYLHLLFPSEFKSYWKFAKHFGNIQQGPFGAKPVPSESGLRRLHRLLQSFSVRHTKDEVLSQLPPKTTTVFDIELSKEHRKLYDTLELEAMLPLEGKDHPQFVADVLPKITYLRQIVLDPTLVGSPALPNLPAKTQTVLDLLEDRKGLKTVVASQFKGYIHLLEPILKEHGYKPVLLTGDQTYEQKEQAMQSFQHGAADVALITIRAAGVGINLHAADAIIFTDRDWSAAANEQCEDRLHRVGQKNNVSVYILEAKSTVDNRIHLTNKFKEYLAVEVLDKIS